MAFWARFRVDIWIFVLALAVRVFLFMLNFEASGGQLIPTIVGDDGYYQFSQALLRGEGLSAGDPPQPNSLRTPLYPATLAGLFLLLGSFWGVVAVHIALGALIPVLGRRLILRLLSSERVANWTGILLSFEPYLVLFSSIFYTETLFIIVFLIALLYLDFYLERGTFFALAASSFLLGIGVLVKATIQYLPILLALLFLWHFRKRFSWIKNITYTALFLLIFVVTLSPWLYRNYQTFGVIALTSQPAYNLYTYLLPSVISLETGKSLQEAFALYGRPEETTIDTITVANAKRYTAEALSLLEEYPKGVLYSSLVSAVTFFTHDGMLYVLQHAGVMPDSYLGKPALTFFLTEPVNFFKTILSFLQGPMVLVFVMRLFWILITFLFIASFFVLFRERRYTGAFLAGILVLYFLLTTMVNGLGVNARFRMPITPIIFGLALYAMYYPRASRALTPVPSRVPKML